MYQELIDELLKFTMENDLCFDYYFDDELKIYYFRFQDQAQTWAYCREVTQEQLDLFNGPIVCYALDIIETLRGKPFYESNKLD